MAAPVAAMTYRMTRAALAEAGEELFVRSARAKGVRERRVWRRHARPAALPPVLSLAAVNMALLITNVVLVESAFTSLASSSRPTSPSSVASSRAP
ncbi:MAG TPA: ABC transporter permease subunit [Solirubrobacteraceae bacterium]